MDEEEFAECIRSATDSLKRIADALSKEAEAGEDHGRCEDDD